MVFLVELLIAVTFAGGFVTYYRKVWQRAFVGLEEHPVRAFLLRSFLVYGTIATTFIVDYTGARYLGVTASVLLINIAFFMLAITLIDRKSTVWEFAPRFLGILALTTWHHLGSLDQPLYVLAMIGLTGSMLLLWTNRDAVRYNIARHSLLYGLIGAFYWLCLPNPSLGMPMTGVILVQGFVMYMLMNTRTSFYLAHSHKEVMANEENAQQAHVDQLTDAWTYATYKEDTTELFDRARTEDLPFTMAVLDIDHFKQINDHYGHLVGDELLAAVARLLEKTLRGYSSQYKLYRTGGEEFNIVFPDLTAAGASPIVKDCWREIGRNRLKAGDYDVATTVSFGVAQMLPTDQSSDDIYARADESLYQSKRSGRNAVTVMGKTLNVTRRKQIFATRTLFIQHVWDVTQSTPAMAGFEVLLAHYEYSHDCWQFPRQFAIPLNTQLDYVRQVMRIQQRAILTLHLTMDDFFDLRTPEVLQKFAMTTPGITMICVIPERRPKPAALHRAAEAYHAAGLYIGLSLPATAQASEAADLQDMDCVKFHLDELRAAYGKMGTQRFVASWERGINSHEQSIIMSGIETRVDAAFARDILMLRYLEGYYFERPELPRLS